MSHKPSEVALDSARDLAVEIVDRCCGYTMEYAASPKAHAREYDRTQEQIATLLEENTPPPTALADAVDDALRDEWRHLGVMDIAHKVDLRNAINAYTETCGGDTSEATVSDKRCIAVAAVESVVWSNEAKVLTDRDRYRKHMEWIGRQFCDRTKDADVRVCPQSGDCLTEWCLSCYAWAVLQESSCDECGQQPDGCYCAEDAETKEVG